MAKFTPEELERIEEDPELWFFVEWSDGFSQGWRVFPSYADYEDWREDLPAHYMTGLPRLFNTTREEPWKS